MPVAEKSAVAFVSFSTLPDLAAPAMSRTWSVPLSSAPSILSNSSAASAGGSSAARFVRTSSRPSATWLRDLLAAAGSLGEVVPRSVIIVLRGATALL